MRRILVTGGCGFIGTNLALDRLGRGDEVVVLDNCARPGTEQNRAALAAYAATHPLRIVDGDVRDPELLLELAADADAIFHLAAQVAVTSSVADPRTDSEVNARGTLNVLEAARAAAGRPVVVFASTNKVYGALSEYEVEATGTRYLLPDLALGVPETQRLDFHSPYGCSKGAADQYVLDYARVYGLRTVVFRQSCIYGPWQYGNEDQGWIAHFVFRALEGSPIVLYGDGRQVRDVLYVDDLLAAYDAALDRIHSVSGGVYNIGGGPRHTTSLLEFVALLEELLERRIEVSFGDWRPGDQRVYVSDVRAAALELGWAPRVPLDRGVLDLKAWAERGPTRLPA